MGERRIYYEQRRLACEEPDKYMSIISDGMAQNHTVLPWLGNQKMFSSTYTQHLQGILVHGREMLVYRSFANLKNDANLSIYCILAALERRISQDGKLPDTVFIRVDGGSENANKYMLAICELLVARRLTKKIVLSRLPVGHTHEDIDGKFGILWRGFRLNHIITPQVRITVMLYYFSSTCFYNQSLLVFLFVCIQRYKVRIEMLLNGLSTSLPTTVLDVWAVPDYKLHFAGSLNDIKK